MTDETQLVLMFGQIMPSLAVVSKSFVALGTVYASEKKNLALGVISAQREVFVSTLRLPALGRGWLC